MATKVTNKSMGLSRLKVGVVAISYFSLNGLLFFLLIWSILFKVKLGLAGKADNYFQLFDFLDGLKWLSLAGLGVLWLFGYLTVGSVDSRLLRWFVKGTIVLFLVLLISFLFLPSH